MKTQRILIATFGNYKIKYTAQTVGASAAEIAADIIKHRSGLGGKALKLRKIDPVNILCIGDMKSRSSKHS